MEMRSSSDEALLAGFAAGDPPAAAAFVRRFQRRVYGLAVTILDDPGAAEDVAQETFVRAWRHASAYDARRGMVSTWLLTIARNLALDRARVRRAQPLDPHLLASRLHEHDDADGLGDQIAVEDRERLDSLLSRLSPPQRRALVLAVYLGRTAREIAELEHVPLGTAKTRIRNAMLRLRGTLEVDDGFG
jgi:RNA polymerase sigma-70 factor (ECF subfamily)